LKEWQSRAKELYFGSSLGIGVVAEAVGKTRQTVSAFLKGCPEWNDERSRRKYESKLRRKKGQLLWDRSNRAADASIRREHEQAVRELSAEKYH